MTPTHTYTACIWRDFELVDIRTGPFISVLAWARSFLTLNTPNAVGLFANISPSDKEI